MSFFCDEMLYVSFQSDESSQQHADIMKLRSTQEIESTLERLEYKSVRAGSKRCWSYATTFLLVCDQERFFSWCRFVAGVYDKPWTDSCMIEFESPSTPPRPVSCFLRQFQSKQPQVYDHSCRIILFRPKRPTCFFGFFAWRKFLLAYNHFMPKGFLFFLVSLWDPCFVPRSKRFVWVFPPSPLWF